VSGGGGGGGGGLEGNLRGEQMVGNVFFIKK